MEVKNQASNQDLDYVELVIPDDRKADTVSLVQKENLATFLKIKNWATARTEYYRKLSPHWGRTGLKTEGKEEGFPCL